MPLDRRIVLSAGLGAGLAAAANAGPRQRAGEIVGAASVAELGLVPGAEHDQTAPCRPRSTRRPSAALRSCSPGPLSRRRIELPDSARLIGTARATTLIFIGGSQFLTSEGAGDIVIDGLVLDGGPTAPSRARTRYSASRIAAT